VERLPIAVVRVPVAADWLSVRDFSSDEMNEPRAALPAAEVSLASSAESWVMYALMPASALLVDSVCSGVRVPTTPALIGLMILQSAAETPVAAAEAAGEEAGVLAAADVVAAAVEDAGALDELDELLLHPAMRAPPTARTARTERDERWNISATSMGAELSVASHENLVLP
jgi:hypothetical protein